jgi:membrane protease YdiL (CAAX protease family)
MEAITSKRAVNWTIWTIFTPLAVSLFAANFYIAAWFARRAMAGTPHQGPPPFGVIQRGVLLTAGVGLWFTVFLWWFLQRKRDSFSTLFQTRTERLGSDLGVGLVLGAAWVAIYGVMGWPAFSAMFRWDAAKLASVPTSVSAGFCEEFLFRGFLLGLILRAGGGPKSQVLWSSLAFGVAHVLWGPVGMLFTVALGASFAVVTLWRGSVWAAVAAHTLLNLCIEPGLMEKVMTFSPR